MEKKQYIYPLTQITVLITKELMTVSEESGFPDDPGGKTPAPRRKTEVF